MFPHMAGTMVTLVLLLALLCPRSHADQLASPPSSSALVATDELALLAFKSMLLSDGGSPVLASWNMSSHFCRWLGVACSREKQVVALRLGSSNLSGRISPHLGNLSALAELDLGGNRLSGEIPPELGRLSRLRSLNLSANSLGGAIPAAISAGCTNLTSLVLGRNSLREYGAGNMVSTNGDIYSYGILVLETVTGKRPTDTIFGQGPRLREYVEQALDHSMMDVIDKRLGDKLQTTDDLSRKKKMDCLMSLLGLGMCCCHETPSSRMRTGDIVKQLHAVKESIF